MYACVCVEVLKVNRAHVPLRTNLKTIALHWSPRPADGETSESGRAFIQSPRQRVEKGGVTLLTALS